MVRRPHFVPFPNTTSSRGFDSRSGWSSFPSPSSHLVPYTRKTLRPVDPRLAHRPLGVGVETRSVRARRHSLHRNGLDYNQVHGRTPRATQNGWRTSLSSRFFRPCSRRSYRYVPPGRETSTVVGVTLFSERGLKILDPNLPCHCAWGARPNKRRKGGEV